MVVEILYIGIMQQLMSNADNLMNWKSKKLFTFASSALLVVVAFANLSEPRESEFCSCSAGMTFATDLPMSHPINRCASSQVSEVSWSSWFKGQSKSYQFHFLDLLELLSRNTESHTQHKTPI